MLTDRVLQEYVEEVIKQGIAAEPHHGPVWQVIEKDDKNVGKSMKELLAMVADALQ
ncbi:hypothetical protein F4604DRAFT_1803156 [Suillus subluteus]|nr:hypothetical protein F4604DRAFT_1803156 [Suillus subluteus]